VDGYTDLGTLAPEALGRAAREVRRAYRVRLLAQDGQLLLGVSDRDPVAIGATPAPDGDYGSVCPKFLTNLSLACRRLALTYAPPRFRWGRRGPRIQYADAQHVRLWHRGDELVIRAGNTTFCMSAERQDVYACDPPGMRQPKWRRRWHHHHDTRTYWEIMQC